MTVPYPMNPSRAVDDVLVERVIPKSPAGAEQDRINGAGLRALCPTLTLKFKFEGATGT